MAHKVRERQLADGLPCLSLGEAPARVVSPGIGMTNANPSGIPDARLVLYENRAHGGTFTDRRFGRDVVDFLTALQTGVKETRK